MSTSERTVQGLQLFKSLVKDGCTRQGDVFSRKWSECLYYTEEQWPQVENTLKAYMEGIEYRLEGDHTGGAVWIC